MSEYHRLMDHKYSEAEYLFQTIEMAKSEEEYDVDVDLCSTSPTNTDLEYELMANDPSSIYSWKLLRRRRPRRRYTLSYSGGGSSISGAPPAPPSTPTSLTPTGSGLTSTTTSSCTLMPTTLASTSTSALASASASASAFTMAVAPTANGDDEQLDNLLYILDYAPKYKKKLREQQRTDAELAELLNVVSLTASTKSSSAAATSKTKHQPEHGVCASSRTIRKHDATGSTKIFKIRRNIRELFRDVDEDDSVSAPEYDTEEEEIRFHRLGRIKPSRRMWRRQRRFARFEHEERMEAMVDVFDEAMTFNDDD